VLFRFTELGQCGAVSPCHSWPQRPHWSRPSGPPLKGTAPASDLLNYGLDWRKPASTSTLTRAFPKSEGDLIDGKLYMARLKQATNKPRSGSPGPAPQRIGVGGTIFQRILRPRYCPETVPKRQALVYGPKGNNTCLANPGLFHTKRKTFPMGHCPGHPSSPSPFPKMHPFRVNLETLKGGGSSFLFSIRVSVTTP